MGEVQDIWHYVYRAYKADPDTIAVFAFMLAALMLAGGGIGFLKWREDRRIQGLRLAAQAIGFDLLCQRMPWYAWSREKHFTVPEQAKRPFSLFSTEGDDRAFDYIAQGVLDGIKVLICQYEYFTGAGKGRTLHRHAICIMDREGPSLPRFVVRRKERSFDWFLRLLPSRLVDFDDHPKFSSIFFSQTKTSSAETVLEKDLSEFITANRSSIAWLETMGPAILVDLGRALKPHEFSAFLDLSRQLLHRVEGSSTN